MVSSCQYIIEPSSQKSSHPELLNQISMFEKRPDDMKIARPMVLIGNSKYGSQSVTFPPSHELNSHGNADLTPLSSNNSPSHTPLTPMVRLNQFPDVHIPLVPKESEVSFAGMSPQNQSKAVFVIGKPHLVLKNSAEDSDSSSAAEYRH